ncbi:hypothetical protein WR25_26179 [Diploscapter pachys]|uniref:Battenin n=1 Tax=Diploscapter pachys TaxID=2018661 RepID=A0A2A2J5W7_9BILA|nr:hypothetical protein WR25_26179 [Diploscapter pachys]
MTASASESRSYLRNYLSFWIFGLANNVAYVVMLTAAKDILSDASNHSSTRSTQTEGSTPLNHTLFSNPNDLCLAKRNHFHCTTKSTGYVLICNIVPALIIKILAPFFIHRIPYSLRQVLLCIAQGIALLLAALSESLTMRLCGVLICSLAYGFGESSFLGLASHYDKYTIGAWSSGTGMAGVAGSMIYASLTDDSLLDLDPRIAMFVILVPPIFVLIVTYFCIIEIPDTIRRLKISDPSTWIDFKKGISNEHNIHGDSLMSKMKHLTLLYKYMIPLVIVYFTEYLINQGIHELTIFDCNHSFSKSPTEQYRWFAVCYAIGCFISRSSVNLIHSGMFSIALMPFLQMINLILFVINAYNPFFYHFGIAAGIVIYEGLIGGWAYANAFHHIHRKVDEKIREFALSAVSVADATGILIAALSAIPTHNLICDQVYPSSSHI